MYQLNRTDVYLMTALDEEKADAPVCGLTIEEIMVYLDSISTQKSRVTVYRRLRSLVINGYIAKGVLEHHSDTFYILEKGKKFLRKGNTDEH